MFTGRVQHSQFSYEALVLFLQGLDLQLELRNLPLWVVRQLGLLATGTTTTTTTTDVSARLEIGTCPDELIPVTAYLPAGNTRSHSGCWESTF